MSRLKKTASDLVQTARGRIKEIPSEDVVDLLSDKKVVIVDLRDIRERQREGFIPTSIHAPRGMIEFWVDPESPYFKPVFGKKKRFIFYCASGWRSAPTVSTLKDMGFEAEHIGDGFTGWIKNKGPVDKPID